MQEQRLLLTCDSYLGGTPVELLASTNQSNYSGADPGLGRAASSVVQGQISITPGPPITAITKIFPLFTFLVHCSRCPTRACLHNATEAICYEHVSFVHDLEKDGIDRG